MSGFGRTGREDGGSVSLPFASGPDLGPGLLRALRNTGISVIYQGLDLRVIWARNIPESWSTGDLTNMTDSDFLPPSVAPQVVALKERVLETSKPARMEINVPFVGGARWFDLWVDADTDSAGAIRGLITTAVETTDQKRREQTLRALLREVSHRSKNLLSIIQSIATQTGRYSGTIDSFMTRFRGRLQSMATSQDLVTSSNWRGADLRELAVGQVARYSQNPATAIRFEGEIPWLSPNAALHIGLALHELAVNSVSYGALSHPGGYVTISAKLIEPSGSGLSLSLRWTELIDTAELGHTPREKRFGSVALERVVPTSLNGAAKLEFNDGRLDYTLVIPHGQFEVD